MALALGVHQHALHAVASCSRLAGMTRRRLGVGSWGWAAGGAQQRNTRDAALAKVSVPTRPTLACLLGGRVQLVVNHLDHFLLLAIAPLEDHPRSWRALLSLLHLHL